MKTLFTVLLLCGAATASALDPKWTLVWSDEFNGPSIDLNNWTYDLGAGGWGNNELQNYTSRPENSYLASGCLVIEARQEKYQRSSYTSARMKTQGLRAFAYGRMEASIALPGGQGIWPAFWMLGANFPVVGWPACGELDILEHVETADMPLFTVRGSIHGPNYSGANSVHGDARLASGLTNVFHTYAVEWSPTQIRWFLDDNNYFTATPDLLPANGTWVIDHPFFFILNVAVGGAWPGSPNATTPFPARMLVDYVRVYRDSTALPPPNGLKASFAMATAMNGPNWQAIATVTVTDMNGSRVSGVNVEGLWSGIINVGTTQKVTDSNGVAILSSGRVKQNGTITLTLVDLDKTGCVYAPTGTDSASVTK